jgi:hypothetical protein
MAAFRNVVAHATTPSATGGEPVDTPGLPTPRPAPRGRGELLLLLSFDEKHMWFSRCFDQQSVDRLRTRLSSAACRRPAQQEARRRSSRTCAGLRQATDASMTSRGLKASGLAASRHGSGGWVLIRPAILKGLGWVAADGGAAAHTVTVRHSAGRPPATRILSPTCGCTA